MERPRNRHKLSFAWRCPLRRSTLLVLQQTRAVEIHVLSLFPASTGSLVAYVRLLWMRNNCPGAARHCQIHVRKESHDRNASGDGEGQGENLSYLFHGRVPSLSCLFCQNRDDAGVTAITFCSFSTLL